MPNQKLTLDNFQVGMVDEQQLSKMTYPDGAAISAVNVYYTPRGALTKRNGIGAIHTTSPCSAAFTKLHLWTDSQRYPHTLAFSVSASTASASIYDVDTSLTPPAFSAVHVTAGAWKPSQLDAITVDNYAGSAVFSYTGSNFSPVAYNGTNCVTLTAAPSGARALCSYYNYLVVGNFTLTGTRYASRVQWNSAGDTNSWPAINWLDLDPDDGDEITALASFNEVIIAWKHNKMFVLYYIGGMAVFQPLRLSTYIGCVGPNAWYDDKDNIYFMSDKGAYAWTGQGLPAYISEPLLHTFESFNWPISIQFEVQGFWELDHIMFSVASHGSSTRDTMAVYDTLTKSWSMFTMNVSCMSYGVWQGVTTYASATLSWTSYPQSYDELVDIGTEVMLMGNYQGFIGSYGNTTEDFGNAVNGYWVSRWLDMGNADLTKRIMRITVMVDRGGSYNLGVQVYKDWNTTVLANYSVPLSNPIYTTGMIEKRVDFTLQGRAFRVQVGTSDPGTPFTVHKLIVEWVQKGKTLVNA